MGQHCAEQTCKQLDYLPSKCDACQLLFCQDHLPYDDHKCNSLYKKNVKVPVCPLCEAPIPVPRGTVPDLAVSAHIEENCRMKNKEKVFTNKCNKPKCKKKELVACVCSSCKLNFCLTHRHPSDHACQGPAVPSSRAAAAAAARASTSSASGAQAKITNFFSGPFRPDAAAAGRQPSPAAVAALNRQAGRGVTGRPLTAPTRPAAANAGLSEDEALAAALAASLQGGTGPGAEGEISRAREEEDRMLALALQESERQAQARRSQTAGGDRQNCRLQ